MTFKSNYLAYLNLHLAVYLCYEMIYVKAIIKESQYCHMPESVSFSSVYPTHF